MGERKCSGRRDIGVRSSVMVSDGSRGILNCFLTGEESEREKMRE